LKTFVVCYFFWSKASCSKVCKLLVIIVVGASLATLGLVDAGDDWVAYALELLHLVIEGFFIGIFVRVDPVLGVGKGVGNGASVVVIDFVSESILVFNCGSHVSNVLLESLFGVDTFLELLVLLGVFLGVGDHLVNFLPGKASAVVGN
jgi:hypothetical protein